MKHRPPIRDSGRAKRCDFDRAASRIPTRHIRRIETEIKVSIWVGSGLLDLAGLFGIGRGPPDSTSSRDERHDTSH